MDRETFGRLLAGLQFLHVRCGSRVEVGYSRYGQPASADQWFWFTDAEPLHLDEGSKVQLRTLGWVEHSASEWYFPTQPAGG